MSNSYEGVHQDKKRGKRVLGEKKLRTPVLDCQNILEADFPS